MSKEVQKIEDRSKKYHERCINTFLDQVPKIINSYPKDDQTLLKEFLNVVQQYAADTSQKRLKFINMVDNFIKEHYTKDKRYYSHPFLWAVIDYLKIARRILNVEGFKGEEFYSYLCKILLGSSETSGLFKLIYRKKPLKDSSWEDL
ncbi:MAG: hypothetical protein ACFE95_00215 [Candidatus Hodarchaeota archaeon]